MKNVDGMVSIRLLIRKEDIEDFLYNCDDICIRWSEPKKNSPRQAKLNGSMEKYLEYK